MIRLLRVGGMPWTFFNSIGPRLPVRQICLHGEFRGITGRGVATKKTTQMTRCGHGVTGIADEFQEDQFGLVPANFTTLAISYGLRGQPNTAEGNALLISCSFTVAGNAKLGGR